MFNFFKKKKPPKEENLAHLKFFVNNDGEVLMDCRWKEFSHLVFAELLEKVSNGDMFSEILDFVRDEAKSQNRDKEFMEIISFLMMDQEEEKDEKEEEEEEGDNLLNKDDLSLVIKPSEVLNNRPQEP
tara:strand:- start:33 stop:416 length:384 start_codon:yes stop_codon:yes gene_type:complete